MLKPPCFSRGNPDSMGVAGLFDGNVVVFLRKIKWISYRGSGDGVTLCEFNMWFIVRFSRGNRWGYISR